MTESICNDTIIAAWESLQDTTFAMWDDLATLGWAMLVVLMIFLLVNIAFIAIVVFSPPTKKGKRDD